MKRLVSLIMVLGLAVGIVLVTNIKKVEAWMTSAMADVRCADNQVQLFGTFLNDEPAVPAGAINVTIRDTVTGNAVQLTVAGQTTSPWQINTGLLTTAGSEVTVEQHWADGREDIHSFTVPYGALDCTPPPPKPMGATSATQRCDATTGTYIGDVTLENPGEMDFTVQSSSDFPSTTPWLARSGTAERKSFVIPGNVSRSSYQLVGVTPEGETIILRGDITPVMNGECLFVPGEGLPPANPISTPPSAPPELAYTGSTSALLAMLGTLALLVGGICICKTRQRLTESTLLN